jgi:hypothetical protein
MWLKHAASVHPEQGSNSSYNKIIKRHSKKKTFKIKQKIKIKIQL